jgi:hypothetical protein
MYAPHDDTDAHPLLPSATRQAPIQPRVEACCNGLDCGEGILGLILIIGFECYVCLTLHQTNTEAVHAACGGLWGIVLAHLVVPLVVISVTCSVSCMQCTSKLTPYHQDRLSFLFTGVVALCCAVMGLCGYFTLNSAPACTAADTNARTLIYTLYVYLIADALILGIIAVMVILRGCVSSWTADGHI